MEQRLPVQVPVCARPLWDRRRFDHLHAQVLRLQRVIEGPQEVQYELAWRLSGHRELTIEHLGVELGVRQLALDHVRHDLGRAPDDSRVPVDHPTIVVDAAAVQISLQDVTHVEDGVEWGHLLVRQRRRQLLLEVVLDLRLLVVQDVCDVGDDEQLARAFRQLQRFDLDAQNFIAQVTPLGLLPVRLLRIEIVVLVDVVVGGGNYQLKVVN